MKDESKALEGHKGIPWTLKKEYLFHAQVNKLVKQVAEEKSREFRILRSWGSVGDGIDWKTTIRSKATGENAIYIRKPKRGGFKTWKLNPFTSIVFIFDETEAEISHSIHDSNITLRNIELDNEHIRDDFPDPDFVYSIFYTLSKTQYLCENHIRKKFVSAILFLCTQNWTGIEPYKRITARPVRFHCRTELDADEELRIFNYPDKLVACGVKYAEKVVIVVSENTWKPSLQLFSFAKVRRVQIIRIPLSTLSQELIERMKYMHMISTPLKKHPDQESIVDRFVPDSLDS